MESEGKMVGARVELSRRGACGMLAGLVALPLVDASHAAITAGFVRGDIRYVLTDARHPESLQFAAKFERAGVARLEVTDGLTKLWREALVPLWQNEDGLIAGLTRRETWECVAEQARSCQRRSILSGHHVFSAEGVAGHRVSATPSTLVGAAELDNCGSSWPGVMADMAMRCSVSERRAIVQAQFGTPARVADIRHGVDLVSWVIA